MEKESSKQNFPIGIIIILLLTGWGILSLLRSTMSAPVYQFGPVLLSGAGATIINLVTVTMLAIIFFGILKRMMWARTLGMGWFSFTIAHMVFNLISLLGNKTMYNSYYQELLAPEVYSSVGQPLLIATFLLGSLFGSISALIIVIYLKRKKDFFVH